MVYPLYSVPLYQSVTSKHWCRCNWFINSALFAITHFAAASWNLRLSEQDLYLPTGYIESFLMKFCPMYSTVTQKSVFVEHIFLQPKPPPNMCKTVISVGFTVTWNCEATPGTCQLLILMSCTYWVVFVLVFLVCLRVFKVLPMLTHSAVLIVSNSLCFTSLDRDNFLCRCRRCRHLECVIHWCTRFFAVAISLIFQPAAICQLTTRPWTHSSEKRDAPIQSYFQISVASF